PAPGHHTAGRSGRRLGGRFMTGPTDVLARARTWLFVPGDRPDRFARAHRSGADVVVVDLEDAVAPDDRDDARANLGRAVAERGHRPVVVRVNPTTSAQHRTDLDAVTALAEDLAGVMLPKVEQPDEVRGLSRTTGLPVVGL